VSNLTNLLALSASDLSFIRFAALMLLPWLAAVAVEYGVFRRWFAADLAAGGHPPRRASRRPLPAFTTTVLCLTLVGFAATSLAGVEPVWAALGGAVVLAVRGLLRSGADTPATPTTPPGELSPRDRRPPQLTLRGLVASASPLFCLFVLALGVVVKAVVDNGLGSGVGAILPGGSSLGALLAVAGVAAALANVINNLPAVLALLPVVGPAGPGPVLAALNGVNLGPNFTYVGSLSTLLWRRILHEHGTEPTLGHFTRLGLITVPATLVIATVALWGALTVIGT
jgi:arsenical pump membrane protein